VVLVPTGDRDTYRVFRIQENGRSSTATEVIGEEAGRLKLAHWQQRQRGRLGDFRKLAQLIGTGQRADR
jgi:hypothetical protein